MAGEVKWEGKKLLLEIDKIKRSALRKIGNAVARDARALCPVGFEMRFGNKIVKEREPGTLRASIRVYMRKSGNSVQVIAGSRRALLSGVARRFIGRDPYYAQFVEYGTSRMMARPFLRPAMKKNHSRVMAEFTNKLK